MNRIRAWSLAFIAIAPATNGLAQTQTEPNPDSHYHLGPDSLAQDGVPKGEIRGPFTLPSQVFPGTQHTYWIYVPAQYDPLIAASLMIFNDGQAFMAPEGDLRAQNVMDNLIYRREIPVMIAVFINPGRRPEQPEPNPHGVGRPHHQPAYRIQLARRQLRPRDLRRAAAGALQGVQHLKRPRTRTASAAPARALSRRSRWPGSVPTSFTRCSASSAASSICAAAMSIRSIVRKSEKKPIRIFLQDGRNDNRGAA